MPDSPSVSNRPSRQPPRWSLSERPSLMRLRKQAKDLKRGIAAADPRAVELVDSYDPGPGEVGLARAQRVLARAYGFAGWAELRRHLDVVGTWSREMDPHSAIDGDDRVAAFLRLACLSYSEPYAGDEAAAMLRAEPGLATANAATQAACGQADALAELLRLEPLAVSGETGPHRWPPLLYLCYSRLAVGDPIATLRVLLAAGADPDSGFLWRGLASPFTAVTGVLGGGERDEPPHPRAAELATLLLDAGADPNDNQAFYNRQFRPDDDHLPPLLGHGAGRPRPSRWRDRLGSSYPSPEQMVGEHLRSSRREGLHGPGRDVADPRCGPEHPRLPPGARRLDRVRAGRAQRAPHGGPAAGAGRRTQ